jgi:hypothetical protein
MNLSADVLEEHDELFERSESDFSMSLSASVVHVPSAVPVAEPHAADHMDNIQDFSMQDDDSLRWSPPTVDTPQDTHTAPVVRIPSATATATGGAVSDMAMESPDVSFDQRDSSVDAVDIRSAPTASVDNTGNSSFDEDSGRFGAEEDGDGVVNSPGFATLGRALKSDVVSFLHHRVGDSGGGPGDDEGSAAGVGLGDTSGAHSFASNSEGDEVLMGTNRLNTYGDTISSLDSPLRMTPSKSPTLPQLEEGEEHGVGLGVGVSQGASCVDGESAAGSVGGSPSGGDQALIKWVLGRAPLELVETANALDVFVSAVRFDTSSYGGGAPPKVCYFLLEDMAFVSPCFCFLFLFRFRYNWNFWANFPRRPSRFRQASACLCYQLASLHVSQNTSLCS